MLLLADEVNDMDNLLLRIPEVAENLGISRAKVYELMAAAPCRQSRLAAAAGCARRIWSRTSRNWQPHRDSPSHATTCPGP